MVPGEATEKATGWNTSPALITNACVVYGRSCTRFMENMSQKDIQLWLTRVPAALQREMTAIHARPGSCTSYAVAETVLSESSVVWTLDYDSNDNCPPHRGSIDRSCPRTSVQLRCDHLAYLEFCNCILSFFRSLMIPR